MGANPCNSGYRIMQAVLRIAVPGLVLAGIFFGAVPAQQALAQNPTPTITTPEWVTSNETKTYSITFDEDVFGFDELGAANPDVSATNATVANLQGSGTTYSVDITPNGIGIRYDIEVTIPAGAAQNGGGAPSAEETATIKYDSEGPRPLVDAGMSLLNSSDPFVVKINFGDEAPLDPDSIGDVLDFDDVGDVTAKNVLTDTMLDVTAPQRTSNQDEVEYEVTVTPQIGSTSDIEIVVPANAAQDLAGNPTSVSSTYLPYDLKPDVVFDVPNGFTTLDEIEIPITFSIKVSGLAESDFVFDNATYVDLVGSDISFTLTIKPDALGNDIEITLAEDAVSDEHGRRNALTTVVIAFGGAESDTDVVAVTTEYIAKSLAGRVRRIMGDEDPRMLIDRLDRQSRGGQAGTLNAGGSVGNLQMSFETSVETLLHYAAFVDEQHAAAEPRQQAAAAGGRADGTGFDFWTRATFARSETDDTDLDVWLVYAGLDYRFNDRFLVGVLGQVDITDQVEGASGTAFNGTGWLAGPYAALRLHDNLLIDGRFAWGKSANEVNPLGAYADDFDTTRWLARGQITGSFVAGSIDVRPFVQFIYFDETQDDYTDTLGNRIPELNVAFGHIRFGPEVRTHIAAGKNTISPFVSVSGLWEFDRSDDVMRRVALEDLVHEDLRARVDTGVSVASGGGWSATLQAFYDGIGHDDAEAWGGSALVRIPF